MKFYRRKSYKGRTYGRKKKTAYRSKRRLVKQVKRFKKERKHQEIHCKFVYNNITGNPLGSNGYSTPTNPPAYTWYNSHIFSDANMNGFSNYASIYQWYRVNKIVVRFEPVSQLKDENDLKYTGVGQVPTEVACGNLMTVIDYTDGSIPTSIDELRRYQNLKITHAGRTCVRKFTPAVNVPIYQTGSNWAYGAKYKQWIRTIDDPNFYGLKWAVWNPDGSIGASTSAILPRWRIDVYAYVSFKTPIPGFSGVDRLLASAGKQIDGVDDDDDVLVVTEDDENKEMISQDSPLAKHPHETIELGSRAAAGSVLARAVARADKPEAGTVKGPDSGGRVEAGGVHPARARARAVVEKSPLNRTLSQHFIEMNVKDTQH